MLPKSAFFLDTVLGTAIGGPLGKLTAPKGYEGEGALRGAARGASTGMGFGIGSLLAAAPEAHTITKAILNRDLGELQNIDLKSYLSRALPAGAVGGTLGYVGSGYTLGKPSWQKDKEKAELEKKKLSQPLQKVADLLDTVQLQPHQQALTQKYENDPARTLLYMGLGSGKSLAGLALAEQKKQPYTAIVPASLRENMRKEIDKFTDKSLPSDVISYNALTKRREVPYPKSVILDEVQRLRSENSQQTIAAKDVANKADNLIMLSGTPIINRPNELAPLISMLTKKPLSSDEFDQRFVGSKTVNPGLIGSWWGGAKPTEVPTINNEEQFRKLMQGHVDYYHPEHPSVESTREDVPVEMSKDQTNMWRWMHNKLPWTLKWKIKNDFPLSNKEIAGTINFLNGPRQVSLSTYPYLKPENKTYENAFKTSTKLQKAHALLMDRMKNDPEHKSLVFSNFPNAGLFPYSDALTKANIPNAVFHGGLNDAQRKQLVDDYNTNKLKVALLGPSGSEGLSFKGTRLIQILDPHWNAARTRQSEGRGMRFDSHWHLPEDMQNVHIQRFMSRLPAGMKERLWRRMTNTPVDPNNLGRATDDYLINLAKQKDELNQKFLDILKDIGSKNKEKK